MVAKKKTKKKPETKYGVAFFIRIGILVPLLLLLIGGLVYDRAVLVPYGQKKVEEIKAVKPALGTDSRTAVETAAGRKPVSSESIGKYTVDQYCFGRILPFLKPHLCTVVYDSNGHLAEAYAGAMPDDERKMLSK